MTATATMQGKLETEFARLAAEAGLEFVAVRQLADNGLGCPETTWHYMDGLDTRLQLTAAFGDRRGYAELAGPAVAGPDLDWFKTRHLYPRGTGSVAGRAIDYAASYADGDEIRRLLGIIRDLLAPYARPAGRELAPPDGAIGIGRLIECLTGCLAEDDVTADTPVQLGPEFGARLDPAFASGAAVSYLAGSPERASLPPRIVVEYRTARA